LYAGARPDRVASLVLVDGLGMPDGEGQAADRMEAYLDGVASPPVSKVYPSVTAAAARLQRTYPEIDEGFARYLAERGTIQAGEGVCWSYDPRHRIRGAIPYRHAHHLPLLARIRCPVLTVLPGVPTFRPPDIAILEAAIPRLSRVTIGGTTHMIHLQAPDALASAIASFVTTGAASQA
jgi:pimeloyl-ACP methyl ester carboxylesterase